MEVDYINLFVPTKLLLKQQSGVMLGYYSMQSTRHSCQILNINITAILSTDNPAYYVNYSGSEISVLGMLGHSNSHINGDRNGDGSDNRNVINNINQVWCCLSYDDNNNDLHCDSLTIDNKINDGIITLIYYDTRDFMSSQLFGKEKNPDQRFPFVDFLMDTLKRTSNLFKHNLSSQHLDHNISFPIRIHDKLINNKMNLENELSLMLPRRLTASFIEFHHEEEKSKMRTHVRNKSWFPNHKQIKNSIVDTMMMTATGRQLRFRLTQFRHCFEAIKDLRHKRISVSVGNNLSSVAIDVLFGIITTWFLVFYSSPSHWLDVAMKQTDNLVNEVQSLLNLLMGMPAGLKLNRPLNTALGQFFLYHIYLWKTYMIIIKPLFAITVETLVFCGMFGFTTILSVLSDLVSLATIHIYCFYGYAARLYGLQVLGLSALWRLFRGKKWNQLRSRVDSYSYGIDQLFIGTLSFTILLFLLPTVLMYYLVFLVLRVVTLSAQGALKFMIENLSSMPLYMVCLWLVDSKKVAGEVSFQISPPVNTLQSKSESSSSVKMILITKKVSLAKVMATKSDEFKRFQSSSRLSWSDFIQSVIWGKIIYPM